VPLLLGLLLGEGKRGDDALAVLRALPEDALFADAAREAEIRVLLRAGRLDEAAARAQAFVAAFDASAGDWGRLGDVLDEQKRYGPAADAFGRALALATAGRPGPPVWQLHLLRGAMLERADRWPEARSELARAQQLAPNNPLVLNFLGYAQLERGENLDEAEALIAEASRRAPDDASITDSLGWAQFKRGKVEEAIATLQRAAVSDASQAEIHEHLGDALYTAGRKFEARHAWNAALITAEDDVKARVEAKIRTGLAPANAAP
jgi:tetratricopeptide (TPR) repeat protein